MEFTHRRIVEHFPVGPLGCNCTLVGDQQSGEALVFDPGGDVPHILERLQANKLRCVGIVHTHAHFDHLGGTAELQAATQAPLMLHEGDLFLYQNVQMQLDAFHAGFRAPEMPEIDRFLRDDDGLQAGLVEAAVLHTPGHTPGSLCFSLAAGEPVLIAGDTLFRHGIGRTDLWGGDTRQIFDSIRTRLLTLPEETLVITGHGPTTTIGDERRRNPHLR